MEEEPAIAGSFFVPSIAPRGINYRVARATAKELPCTNAHTR